MNRYPRPLHKSTRVRHFAAGAVASFLLFSFLVGVVGCDRNGVAQDGERGVDVEVDVRPAPCDSTRYAEPPVTERREVDPSGNVRVRVTVRTCCCCCSDKDHFSGYVPPSPITGTGPNQPGPRGPAIPPVAATPTPLSPIASLPPLRSIPPVTGGFPGGVPTGMPAPLPPVATASTPWWLTLVAAPLAFLAVDGGDEFPEGIICGDDSGLPTGPTRPRCN